MTLGNPEYVDTEKKISVKKRWYAVLAVLVLVCTTMTSHWEARNSSHNTLQKMLNENGLDHMNVREVWQPIWISIPGYGLLAGGGLASRKVDGTFMVQRKDGGKMRDNCQYEDFTFTHTQIPSGGNTIGINGLDVFKLKECGAAA